jgi:predicted nucleic acid-binding protein
LLSAARRRRVKALVSVAVFLEYEAVLKRAEQILAHGFTPTEIDTVLDAFARFAEPVDRHFTWRPQLADPSDECVLETAINGRADAIVTHNVRDFGPASRFGVLVCRPGEIIRRIKK